MRVLGIDPGSRHTGYGVVELQGSRLSLLACGTLSPGDDLPLPRRLAAIHEGLCEVVRRLSPDAASVEEIYHAANARSALILGQARGVAMVAAASSSVEVYEYAASEIKRAVSGSGRAGKEQVSRMVGLLLGCEVPGDEHACDAIAAAICHLNRARTGALVRETAALEGRKSSRGRSTLSERLKPAVVAPTGGRRVPMRKGSVT